MSDSDESERLTTSRDYGSMSKRTASGSIHSHSTEMEETASQSQTSVEDFEQIQPSYLVEEALEKCKRFLVPYYVGIKFLGWTQLSGENGRALQIIRWCLVLAWNLLLVGTFAIQAISCSSRDRFTHGNLVNITNHTMKRDIRCSGNTILIFIMSDIVILITYWFGLILFSRKEKEHTYNLAEKMFTKMTASQDPSSVKPIIRTIWAFIIGGLIWILCSLAIRFMVAVTIRLYESDTIIQWGLIKLWNDEKDAFVTLSLIGFTTYDVVYFMAITNYVVQCEMVFYLIRSVRKLVNLRQYPRMLEMDAAVKDIYDIRVKLHKLNGKTAAAAALAIFNVAPNVIFALETIDDLRTTSLSEFSNRYLAIVTAVLNVILWIIPLVFPFIQAARVSHQCDKLKQTGFYVRTRPFQYSKTPMEQLDSYLAYTQAAKLRATICGIPIYPWLLYLSLVFVAIVGLVIFESEQYDIVHFFEG